LHALELKALASNVKANLHGLRLDPLAPGYERPAQTATAMFWQTRTELLFSRMAKSSDNEIGTMARPAVTFDGLPLHDEQSKRDHRNLRIDKVGVRGLRFPVQIRDKAHALQNTVAVIGMFVDLPHEFKGTHMSRFIEVLHAHGSVVHVDNIPEILYAMQRTLHATTSHLEMEVPFFL
jgi:hypothetical protein